ncbi:winged helix-turn-helix transcriptional regulator [Tsukamurella tyrosinosolvens]|uniref:MarR family winged helix-turn-helix transcriptional regulator n=1 Tax=Tsukamurella tyrosinosolvens TaxID=57704 RepID=UPI000AD21761|nr:MarR family winged helix-turn-helix transcriptional regulator [Tsukamurella tyrosinosolvens]MCA4993568.1 winged helix-turn-helix transcriptional regulator [Tsukamurella tyrosinosolvens]QRY83107.1 winged helix-turn-helix transcriptional regulator [Tsukamurella tyrosinosolvens]
MIEIDAQALEFGLYHREILNSALREAADPLADVGLTPSLVNVLNVVASFPGASGAFVAEMNATSQQAAARTLSQLISRHLIERTTGESSTYSHRVTAQGREKLFAGLRVAAAQNRELLDALSPEECAEYLRLSRKLCCVRTRKTADEIRRLTWVECQESGSIGRPDLIELPPARNLPSSR